MKLAVFAAMMFGAAMVCAAPLALGAIAVSGAVTLQTVALVVLMLIAGAVIFAGAALFGIWLEKRQERRRRSGWVDPRQYGRRHPIRVEHQADRLLVTGSVLFPMGLIALHAHFRGWVPLSVPTAALMAAFLIVLAASVRDLQAMWLRAKHARRTHIRCAENHDAEKEVTVDAVSVGVRADRRG